MRLPSDDSIALVGTAIVIGLIIFVLPILVPTGTASTAIPANATVTVPYPHVLVTPTDWAYLPYISLMRMPTPTPSTPYITLKPDCMEAPHIQLITVLGRNWPADGSRDIVVFWDDTLVIQFPSRADWELEFVVDAGQTHEGVHVVHVHVEDKPEIYDFEYFFVPCLPAPTP